MFFRSVKALEEPDLVLSVQMPLAGDRLFPEGIFPFYPRRVRFRSVRCDLRVYSYILVDQTSVRLPFDPEFVQVREMEAEGRGSMANLREERARTIEGERKGGMMGTLGRKKEQKLEQLR